MNERYELLAPIAEGGLGAVFRARDLQLGREVAVKRIRADKAGDFGSAVESLIREARQQSILQHPNIVTVHDAGVDDEGGFIVMELVKGETLEDIIMRGALTGEDFDSLVRQTMDGMIAAHAEGIIHLDLKPGNLMITWLPGGRFQVKILDFGLAKTAKQPVQQDTNSQGGLLGSVHFMAPEQFERAEVDPRTDLYALGCVFYYALTQKYPFNGDTNPQVMVAHLYHRVKSLAVLRPDLPEHTVQWIEWLINRIPANRPASIAEALKVYEEGKIEVATPIAEAVAETSGTKLLLTGPSATSTSRLITGSNVGTLPPPPTGVTALQPHPAKVAIPKWGAVTIPFLVILIGGFGVKRFTEKEADFAEQAAVSVIQAQPDRTAAVAPVLEAYRSGKGKEADRALLLHVLGRTGGTEALTVILEGIADPSVSVRKAALSAIAQWPSCDPLPSLTTRMPRETDPACRTLLLLAATQLCSQSGTLPQAELFAQAKRLHEASKDAREKDQALAAISRITDPDAAAFFDALSLSEPQRKAQAIAISKAINAALAKVATVTETTTVSAEKADYPKLSGMDLIADILVNWLDPGDWAAWFLKFDQPGKYEIAVRQASTSQKEGLYEVIIAGQTLRTSVVHTESAQEFKSCIVGVVEIKQPGIHRLRINAVEIPEREQLFRVKAIELVKK